MFDIGIERGRLRRQRSFVAHAPGRRLAVIALARHRRERDDLAAVRRKQTRRRRRHARTVEAGAEMRGHGAFRAAQAHARGAVEVMTQLRRVIARVAAPLGGTLRIPVARDGQTRTCRHRESARLDPLDVAKEARIALRGQQGEKLRHRGFVGTIGHVRQCVQPLRHRGEGEEIAAAMKMQRARPEEIAGQQQRLRRVVPQRESEIAFDAIERIVLPARKRGQEDRRIAHPRRAVGGNAERRRQIVAIVQTHIGDQSQTPVRGRYRALVVNIFRKNAEKTTPHRDRVAGPDAAVMRSVDLLGREHPPTPRREIGPTVRTPHSRDRAHEMGSGRSRNDVDQPLMQQLFEQAQHVALASRQIDLVFAHEPGAERVDALRRGDDLPDARADLVEAVAIAALDIERDDLAVDFGFDDAVPADDHACAGEFRGVRHGHAPMVSAASAAPPTLETIWRSKRAASSANRSKPLRRGAR